MKLVPFKSLGEVSYLTFIVTMAVSVAVCEVFSIKEWMTLKTMFKNKVIGNGTIRRIGCGFLFDFHSNYGRIFNPF